MTQRGQNIAQSSLRRLVVRARVAAAVIAGRAAGVVARRLRLGGGTSLPGLIAARLDPRIIAHLSAQLRHGSAVVTGTNGKTTTSGLLAYVLRAAGLRVWRNREGANLLRGVATALVIRAQPHGKLRRQGNAAAVFEVDEAAFPGAVSQLRPRVVVVTNLFRDQLDRYGEVDTVAERWRTGLAAASPQTALALNADDPAIAALADEARGPVLFFGVSDQAAAERAPASGLADDSPESPQVIDTRTCPRCRGTLVYTVRFYSHIGHWRCERCGFARPTPDVSASAFVADGVEGSRITLETPNGSVPIQLALPGLYNVYNALAAAAAGRLMGADLPDIADALRRFTPAFGRAERIAAVGRQMRILLAKNPTGLNEVLRALEGDRAERRHLLLLLNDLPADGEDVSWIWDADFERVPRVAATVVVAGTRAADLAVRLKYAGLDLTGSTPPARPLTTAPASSAEAAAASIPAVIQPDIPLALDAALAQTPTGETLYIVPTYTAMLAVRHELERRGLAPHYWETADT